MEELSFSNERKVDKKATQLLRLIDVALLSSKMPNSHWRWVSNIDTFDLLVVLTKKLITMTYFMQSKKDNVIFEYATHMISLDPEKKKKKKKQKRTN